MTEVLTSSPESRRLGNIGSFNISTTHGSGSPIRRPVLLLSWTNIRDDDQRGRSNSILQSKRPSAANWTRSAGLTNLGNTCFMNSVLQCLSHTRPLFNYCAEGDYKVDINPASSMGGALISAFAKLTELLRNGNNLVTPAEFKTQMDRFASQYTGHRVSIVASAAFELHFGQPTGALLEKQDAQEFLICLLEGLHEDVNTVRKMNTTDNNQREDTEQQLQQPTESTLALPESEEWRRCLPKDCRSRLIDFFVGVLRSKLVCQVCQHVSESLEPFVDLSLPVQVLSASALASIKRSLLSSSDDISLLDCLQLLVQNETLDADNRPKRLEEYKKLMSLLQECERCKQKQRSTKKFSIDRFPPVLILHLKRFNHTVNGLKKIDTDVKCPMFKLDLTQFATDTSNTSAVYNLYAVCNHHGSPDNGHYTTSARHLDTGSWYCFDDSRVCSIDASAVITPDAYILFYELSDTTSSRL